MHTIDTIIPAIEAYAERHGLRPDLVVRKATGNPRLYERLKSRLEKLDEDVERIARFIAGTPSEDVLPDGSPVLNNQHADGGIVSQVGDTRPGGAA